MKNLNRSFLTTLFFYLISNISYSQLNKPTLYFELGGPSLLYSINYDARFIKNKKIGFRIGLFAFPYETGLGYSSPIQLNYVIGKKHGLELGAGIVIYSRNQNDNLNEKNVYFSPAVLYRYQSSSGLNIRLGFQPVLFAHRFNDTAGGLFLFWPSASFGYRFD